MMRCLLLIALIANPLCSSAQPSWGIKVYQNSDSYTKSRDFELYNSPAGNRKFKFNRFSAAITLSSKKIDHELEFFIPDLNVKSQDVKFPSNFDLPENGGFYTFRTTTWSVRYVVGKSFPISGGLIFRVSAGVNPYYLKTRAHSTDWRFYFEWNDQIIGASINVIPSLKYVLGKRLSIDLSIPLKVYDWQRNSLYIDNPNIPLRQQTESKNHGYFFDSVYTLRFGVQYLFIVR